MLRLYIDERLGNNPRYYVAKEPDNLMLVPDEIRKCAAFVAYKRDDTYVKLGTAFFVSIPDGDDMVFGYIVTAKHIIAKIIQKNLSEVCLRVNTHDGYVWLETDVNDWQPHPDDYRVDASVLPLYLSPRIFDYKSITIKMAATDDIIKRYAIGVGDDVFMTGLFSEHTGQQKNLPIVRTGAIALMPEEPVEVEIMGNVYEIDAYLIEARSIGGLSGSPVFVHMGIVRPPRVGDYSQSFTYYWLGLMHGHWDIPVRPDDVEEDDSTVPPEERVNMGIAIVVPVTKILEIINQPFFEQQRNDLREERKRKKNLPTPDMTDNEGDKNTFSEEDFEEALRKVSRRDKPDSADKKREKKKK